MNNENNTAIAEAQVVDQVAETIPVVQESALATPAVPVEGVSPIATMIASGNFNVETIDKMLDVQHKYENEVARKAYHAAMAEFRKVAPVIKRDKHVQFLDVNYKHASLGYTLGTINPLLGQFGLNPTWKLDDTLENGQIRVTCVLSHALGHTEETGLQSSPDDKKGMNNMQKKKSTVSYLERTTLFAMLGLAEGEDDDGQASGARDAAPVSQFITFEQAAKVRELVETSDRTEEAFLAWCKSDSFEQILAAKYPKILQTLNSIEAAA